jgi:hypothetical protein
MIFRRSFRPTEDSVGMTMNPILDGLPSGFHLACVKPYHFRFLVASKVMGFLMQALKHVTTKHFDVYFHLWQDGGANWRKELSDWEDEEDGQWMVVQI